MENVWPVVDTHRRSRFHNEHGDDGPDTIVTNYTVPPGTIFYYANDADATNKTTNGMYSNDPQVGGTTFTDLSAFSHNTVTVDPEFGVNPQINDVLGHTNFSLTGGTSISNVTTHEWAAVVKAGGDITGPGTYSQNYRTNDDNDKSGLDGGRGAGSRSDYGGGGGWT